jgi:hypothetical protein
MKKGREDDVAELLKVFFTLGSLAHQFSCR